MFNCIRQLRIRQLWAKLRRPLQQTITERDVAHTSIDRPQPVVKMSTMKEQGGTMTKSRNKIQQDDSYKEFMGWITKGGLRHAYFMQERRSANHYQKKVDEQMKRHVIIVGAGMAGLSAAYELAQIGHQVTILEVQSRVGGRVKTFREGFADGLHCEGGAMRLPLNHYLTWHYLDQFHINTTRFTNNNEKTYLYLYGNKIRMEDWTKCNKYYSDKLWPEWNTNLEPKDKDEYKIDGILSYYTATMKAVKDSLGDNPSEQNWHDWLCKWSKFSAEEFLRGHCKDSYPLVPWSEAAIEAFKVSTYTPTLDKDLGTHLREDLGGWWEDPLYAPTNGMDNLPKAFLIKNDNGWNKDVDLSKNIKFGIMTTTVEEIKDANGRKSVRVRGTNGTTGHPQTFEGDAVILTLPLHILRELEIPFNENQQSALSQISYAASTKIMLQCKTRFWEKDVGYGGFSKTNLMFGQLHYPDKAATNVDDERGILLIYTWDSNALTYGSLTKELAIISAIHDISKIHPEIEEQFEVGNVQAWYSDPTAQGAFANLKPYEYIDHMKALTTPTDTMYLAGEALSWSNGWIQGAIFSGLMQAYCFQSHLESHCICEPVSLMLQK